MTRVNTGGLPGIDVRLSGADQQVWWGIRDQQIFEAAYIGSTCVDAGNTPTTQLRAGLILGKVTATGKLIAYTATATDGSQVAYGVLEMGLGMLDAGGTARDKLADCLIGGRLKAGQLIGLDNLARKQLGTNGRFIFDDDVLCAPSFLDNWVCEKAVTDAASPYAIPTAENGFLYTNTGAAGAVQFVLPVCAPGLQFAFYVIADQTVTVSKNASDSGNIVGLNNAAASNAAFSTGSQKIGGGMTVASNAAGTKWHVHNWSAGTNTITLS